MKRAHRRSPQEPTHFEGNTTDKNRAQGRRQAHAPPEQSRKTSYGSFARFTATIAFLLLAEFFTSCNAQQEKTVLRPTVQINDIDVITSTRYIGDAFSFTGQAASASLVPDMDRLPPYAPGISFLGIIAQDTLSSGCDRVKPCDVLLLGIFRQKNGTFRYGYEVNGVRHYAGRHVLASDYKYDIHFYLNEEGLVTDPTYPRGRMLRFGYDFQIWRGWDSSIAVGGLESSPTYANQLFVGGMDEGNAVQLPYNKQLQLRIWPPEDDKTPSVIYKNGDDTSQVSSQYSDTEYCINLTLSGSY
jgi:hypothetical protein